MRGLSAYLCWLAGRFDEVSASLGGERSALRQKAMSPKGHARTAGQSWLTSRLVEHFWRSRWTPRSSARTARPNSLVRFGDLVASRGRQDEAIGEQDPAVRSSSC